jgi:quinol monooxygenase YgiN
MTTISKDAKPVTFINVFTVEPANQQRLVDLLAHATLASVRHSPGFVSATLHRSLDGTKVAMYAQWRTIETIKRCARTRLLATTCNTRWLSASSNLACTRSSNHTYLRITTRIQTPNTNARSQEPDPYAVNW